MDDPLAMGIGQGARHGLKQVGALFRTQATALAEEIRQAFALDEFHGDVGYFTFGGNANLQDAHDVRMAQRTRQGGLTAKTVISPLVGAGQQQLERHGDTLHLIVGAVDRGSPAAAELLADQVAADLLARQIAQAGTGRGIVGSAVRRIKFYGIH